MSRLVGIIGHPVAHSLSPVIQQAAFQQAGIEATYQLWDTPESDLPARIESLRAPEVLGANVTIPHKEAVVSLLDELAGQSLGVGAVNTIVNRDGRLSGYNTDGLGLIAAMKHEIGFDTEGASVMLLGAGGAARGIAFALVDSGAKTVGVWNRTAGRAERLVDDISVAASGIAAHEADVANLARYDCIVNCTSIGMDGTGTEAATPCDLSAARIDAIAVDIVYKPAETPFLRQARARGMSTISGLPMLIHQGALAFELWTGVQPSIDVMTSAAEEALAAPRGGAG